MLNAGLVLTAAMLAGRVAGLLRELLLATVFGVSPGADAAVVLLTLPDLFVNLLVSGGLSAALVPRLASLAASDAKVLLRQASLAALVLFGLIGLLVAAWPQAVFGTLAPGLALPFEGGSAGVVAVALAVPLTALAGVAGAYLNAQQRFLVTGCGTLIFNLAVLAALLLVLAMPAIGALRALAFGIGAGAALRWLAQLAQVPPDSWVARAPAPVADRALLHAFGAATLAAALMLLAPLMVRAMASLLGQGAIASFNYAQKLVELPIAILITSISTVALSRLSALHAHARAADALQAAVRDTRYAILLGLAVMLPGLWFADSAVQVLFGRGRMDADALARVTGLTRIALLTLPLVALSSMAAARLNASGNSAKLLAPTVGALMLLPLMAVPGLLWRSESALMMAVTAFQAVIAVLLARRAGLPLFGSAGVAAWPAGRFAAAVAAAAALMAGIDSATGLTSDWLRLALAAAGFGLAMIPIRLFLRASPLPTLVPAP